MKLDWKIAPLAALLSLAACATSTTERLRLPPLKTVEQSEAGIATPATWYDIASFPQSFQSGCTGTIATYTVRATARSTCSTAARAAPLDGKVTTAKGRARVVDKTSNAQLKVSFFRPFWGDY